MQVKNRHRLKSKDAKKIQHDIQKIFTSVIIEEKQCIETGFVEGNKLVFLDNKPCFIYLNEEIIFTVFGIDKLRPKENFVVIDMGAVKFVTSGADVMAPGITDADTSIEKGDQVWICDEKNHKPLAIGIAIITGEQMINEKKGKAIKVIHYVGDKIWDFVAKSL